MFKVIITLATLFACISCALAACGKTIFTQNFDKYAGGTWTKWTKPMAKTDFAGLIFQKFDTNSYVGNGMLRVMNPKGEALQLVQLVHVLVFLTQDSMRQVEGVTAAS